jgi:nitrogen regulatory protein P-II 1
MKLITAVIQPAKLDELLKAVKAAGVTGMTVSEVQGFGRQAGVTEVYRGAEYTTAFIPKIKVEIVVDDAEVDRLADVIAEATRTGRIGDGKVWTTPVDGVLRIRTGETDADALT